MPRLFRRLALRLSLLLLLLSPGLLPAASPSRPAALSADHARQMAQGRELFTRSVRTVLVDNCLSCHGGKKTRAGLSLATRETLLTGGENGVVVVPGKGKRSRLYRLAAALEEPHMPPKGNKRLTPAQLADLARWIDLGAPYARPLIALPAASRPKTMVVSDDDRHFWSFRSLSSPAVPPGKGAWGNNPVDRFLLAKLQEKGLSPTPAADRRTLLRRITFGLTGLPPTPEEVAAFVKDTRPDAYERLVDRLLASPAHGERWARHWLDVVRFAESHGFEHDYDRPHAYTYRDFVIQALNLDLPYDTFVRWQLAGDEFAPHNPLALTATGFLGAGVHSTQITANTVEKERYDELDDVVRTTGTAMLGLTVGCARCHDHKYDPIPTADYYRLLSTFTKTVRSDADVPLEPAEAEQARLRHAARQAELDAALANYERGELAKGFSRWLTSAGKKPFSPWAVVAPQRIRSAGGAIFTALPDGSRLAGGPNPAFDTCTITLHTHAAGIRAVRLEALAHPSMVRGGPGRAANGNFALSDVKVTVAPILAGKAVPVKIRQARATFEQAGLPVAAAIDADPRSAWAVDPQFGKDHAAVFDLERPVGDAAGSVVTVVLRFNNNTGHNIGRVRLSVATAENPPAVAGDGVPEELRSILARLATPGAKPTPSERAILFAHYRTLDAGWRKRAEEAAAHRARGAPTTRKAMICGEGLTPIRLHSQGGDFLEQTHFLLRGDPNQKKGVATQGFLKVLMRNGTTEARWQESPPAGARTPYRRRSLANWMTDTEAGAGHLLARVIVNRLWQQHFGVGIVATPSDFGLQGDRPTHPELLDYLAGELIRHGWRLKPIHRLIVTSAAYRQATTFDADKARIDPGNRLLWRRTPRRLEAEVIRDSLLDVAGQLDRRMFGPGTLDPAMKRRSIYFFVKRSQLIPMMTLFDAPDGTVGIESRTQTTIAPQALLLLNSPVVRSAAQAFADRLGGLSDREAVRVGYERAVGRPPSAAELADSVAFLAGQRASYRAEKKADAAGLALLDFCQVLLGLNEFVYVD